MFPIIDVRGNVIAFSGRRLNEEDKAKYVNSADTLVYKKGREIFALNHARKTNTDTLILCEGNIDVVMLQSGRLYKRRCGFGYGFNAGSGAGFVTLCE